MKTAENTTCDKDVVIFDGQCKLCRAGTRRLQALDWLSRFHYVPLQDAEIRENYPDLTYDMLMAEMYVVTRAGKRYGGAAAFCYLTWRLPLLWPIAPIVNLPGTLGIWSWLYKIVARNRYRFGRIQECDGGTCHLHFGPKASATPSTQAKN
jgi:predicted DCC family thiol-disulfide oxidoreductase YuxK